MGLHQIVETLSFLHNQAKLIHLNLTPENIYFTKSGEWKIGGLHFSSFANYKDTKQELFDYKEFDNSQISCRPTLDYLGQ